MIDSLPRMDEITYKNPTKVLSVEIEAALKAGHCVEPESDMQVSAIATPGAATRIDSSAVLVLRPIALCLCLRLGGTVWPRAAIVGTRGNPDEASNSTIFA